MTEVAQRVAGGLFLCALGCHPPGTSAPEAPRPTVATAPVAATTTPSAAAPQPATDGRAETETAPLPAATAASAPAFVLRYACDDKYASAECRPGQPAWSAWLAGLALGSGAANLLDQQGGGPSGAEWNPEAPLVAFVLSREPGRVRLKLSGKHALTPSVRWTDYDVFFVPYAAWSRASRPARASDLTDTTAVDAVSVVELEASGQGGQLARGAFAFSGGE